MKPELILKAEILDIIFENRNKDYGAYALRKEYNKRLSIALSSVLLLLITLFMLQSWNKKPTKNLPPLIEHDDTLTLVPVVLPPTVPPPPSPTPLPAATIGYGTPVITKEDIRDSVPSQEDLARDVQIGLKTTAGVPAIEIRPPESVNPGIGIQPAIEPVKEPEIFEISEIMPDFPGGKAALHRFLSKNLKIPEEGLEPGNSVRIVVRFVVEADGAISGIKFLQTGPIVYEKEVLRVINKMPKWKPGIQNGRSVPVYFNIPVIFEIPEE